MKLRRRLRSAIKWAGTVVTPLLLALWIASGLWMNLTFVDPGLMVMFGGGQLDFVWFRKWSLIPDDVSASPLLRNTEPFKWWFDFDRVLSPTGSVIGWSVTIPIWSLVLLTGVPTFLMWRTDRRRSRFAKLNRCVKCGYSKTGLAAARACPECGTRWS